MKAAIMAGGFGTRLHPLTCNVPKPMVPVMGIPIMEHVINHLKSFDITELVIILFHKPDVIKDYFGNGKKFGVKIEYTQADKDYGTAGAVKFSEKYLKDTFLIASADVLTNFDLKKLIDFHKKKRSKATITLTRVKNPLEFGIVITHDSGKIEKFLEKPTWGEVFSDTINTGIYILEPEILDLIPAKTNYDFSKDLFPLLLKKKYPLFGCTVEGYWKDIGNLQEYGAVHQEILEKMIDFPLPGKELDNLFVGEKVKMPARISLSGTSVISDGAI